MIRIRMNLPLPCNNGTLNSEQIKSALKLAVFFVRESRAEWQVVWLKLFTAVVDPLSAILRDVFARTTFKVELSARHYHVFSITSGRDTSMAHNCDLTSIDQSRCPFNRQHSFLIIL